MNKKILITVIVISIIVVIGLVLIISNSKEGNTNTSNTINSYIPNVVNVSNIDENEKAINTENFNRTPENVTIEIDNSTIKPEGVTIIITDNNEKQYGWGPGFEVQQKVNGEWKYLKIISDDFMGWATIAYALDENNQFTEKLNIEYLYGKLNNGIYRIVKDVYDNGYIYIYSNEFEIK